VFILKDTRWNEPEWGRDEFRRYCRSSSSVCLGIINRKLRKAGVITSISSTRGLQRMSTSFVIAGVSKGMGTHGGKLVENYYLR